MALVIVNLLICLVLNAAVLNISSLLICDVLTYLTNLCLVAITITKGGDIARSVHSSNYELEVQSVLILQTERIEGEVSDWRWRSQVQKRDVKSVLLSSGRFQSICGPFWPNQISLGRSCCIVSVTLATTCGHSV